VILLEAFEPLLEEVLLAVEFELVLLSVEFELVFAVV
jgi:hypothetical protein